MANNEQLAIVNKGVVDIVANKIRGFQNRGELYFPANYSPENALKAAWLIIQETKDRNGKPVLTTCTKESVANSLLNMAVQGLNPAKKQGYFIAYGNQLTFQRSYFGSIHVIKSVDPRIDDVVAEVVYANDVFEYEKVRGKTHVVAHKQQIENVDKEKIICAYGLILYKDGSDEAMIMTMDEIKQAWKQAQTKPVDEKGNINANSVHGKFTQEMAKKTVINRLCKKIINASDDSNLIIQAAKDCDEEMQEINISQEIQENANTIPIDVGVRVDLETGEKIVDADFREYEEPSLTDEISDEELYRMEEAERAAAAGVEF